jgi:hypothetical protein
MRIKVQRATCRVPERLAVAKACRAGARSSCRRRRTCETPSKADTRPPGLMGSDHSPVWGSRLTLTGSRFETIMRLCCACAVSCQVVWRWLEVWVEWCTASRSRSPGAIDSPSGDSERRRGDELSEWLMPDDCMIVAPCSVRNVTSCECRGGGGGGACGDDKGTSSAFAGAPAHEAAGAASSTHLAAGSCCEGHSTRGGRRQLTVHGCDIDEFAVCCTAQSGKPSRHRLAPF